MIKEKNTMKILGVNSGTSADSLDISLLRFSSQASNTQLFKLLHFSSFKYPTVLQREILYSGPSSKISDIESLSLKLGDFVAKKINFFLKKNKIQNSKIDAIGLHGQTIHHSQDLNRTVSIQITEADSVSQNTGILTIFDFRKKDIITGGAGAPLAPILDYYLFPEIKRPFICQNLGGIANSTLVESKLSKCIGYDSGPANSLIDKVMRIKSKGKIFYDENGSMARKGKINYALLDKLLSNPYFDLLPPKSTGNREFGIEYANDLYNYSIKKKIKFNDLLATLSIATVESIARSYERFIFPFSLPRMVILSGGGVKNKFLVSKLEERLPQLNFIKSDELGMPSKYKESILFALLAYLRITNKRILLENLTGSNKKILLGKISTP